jgi:ABC-2 type transport system ATP-binding protein
VTAAALAVEGVAKRFGDVEALGGVSLDVAPGEVVGLLGPNGAGKTTLVRAIATLLPADDGRITVDGVSVDADPAAVRERIGLAGQFAAIDELLTGRENLRLVGRLYGLGGDEADRRATALLDALGLSSAGDRRVGTYSGGMRRRLDLGATLIGSPRLLLLDEPTTGLDPRARADVWALIEDVARGGTAVLLTSQNLEEVDRLADRVVVLDRGLVVGTGAPGALKEQVGGRDLDAVFLALTAPPEPDDDDAGPVGAIPSLGPVPSADGGGSALRDVGLMTRRYLTRMLRTPQLLFFATVQPVLFIVGLRAVFAGLFESAEGGDYTQFLVPGVLVMNTVLMAGSTGSALAEDMRSGIIDRFRSLPMASVAVLAGRTTTDLVRNVLGVVLMLAAGFLLGFRVDGLGSGAAALALALLFGYACTWVFAAVGLAVKDPQAATFAGFAPVLPLVYLSSAWVPVSSMAPAVRGFAGNQPVTVTIDAARSLVAGTADGGAVVQSIAWSVGLIVVFAVIATRQYRRSAR